MLKQLLTTIAMTGALMAAQPSLAASPPNMLVIGTNLTGIRTLDPAQNNARTVSELISNLHDNLVQLSPDDLKTLKPMLATKTVPRWSASARPMTPPVLCEDVPVSRDNQSDIWPAHNVSVRTLLRSCHPLRSKFLSGVFLSSNTRKASSPCLRSFFPAALYRLHLM